MKFSFFYFLLFLSYSLHAQNIQVKDLRTGDLLFQDLDCGPMCDAIEAVTPGYKGHKFSHIGLVSIQQDSVMVIESSGTQVHATPIAQFLKRSNNKAWVGRLKKRFQKYIPQAISFSKQQLGVPYDDNFIYNNGKYYCSELIYDAFKYARHQKPFFSLYPMTYKSPHTNHYYPVWQNYFKSLGEPIPEGKPGCNPGGLANSKKIKIIGILSMQN